MIFTDSCFIYGHYIDATNNQIAIKEPFDSPIEKIATLNSGAYTMSDFADEIARSLNAISAQEYAVSLNRTTRKFTISATANFEMLITSGTIIGIDAFELMGFTGADLTGGNSYQSNIATGIVYYPQFKLQNYVSFEDNAEVNLSSVNESASGKVEVVSFGEKRTMTCNVTFITDYEQTYQSIIKQNLSGVQDARDFLNYIIRKREIEFIPDVDDFDIFEKCLLESTSSGQNGTSYLLKELYASGLVGYYETGNLVFRKITE
jgi:hypothetical protein